jgi:hypothetical protein
MPISPATYPLAGSLFLTSSMLFGNVGLSLAGPIPIIKGTIGDITLTPEQKVRAWALFFKRAAVSRPCSWSGSVDAVWPECVCECDSVAPSCTLPEITVPSRHHN